METLTFLSPHPGADSTRPQRAVLPEECSRGRAEAQETAGNTADGVQRKPEVTTKSHSGARFHMLMPPESTKRVWAHAGERAKSSVCPLGGRARWPLNTWSTLTKLSESLVWYREVSPTEY